MKIVTSILIASLAFFTASQAAVKTGAPAPGFTVMDSTGAEHSLSDFKGKYVVLEWTNHTCPFVKKFYKNGEMQALQSEMTAKDVVWLQVLSSAEGKSGYLTASNAESMRTKQKVHSTALLLDANGKIGRAYGARTTPHMFLIDPEGTVIYQGAIDSIRSANSQDIAAATNYVQAAYASAIVGEPIQKSTTTPYGCGVKY
jgi:peroxiredoxin